MMHFAMWLVFLLNFIEFNLSHPSVYRQLRSNVSSVGLLQNWNEQGLPELNDVTDIDQVKLHEALAEEGLDGNLTEEKFRSFIVPLEADTCCRAHDLCPNVLRAGFSMGDLYNDASHSRLSCDCDEEFRQCLYKANTRVANVIGNVYFNDIAQRCFREDYPIIRCKDGSHDGLLNLKCMEYELDMNGPKKYQWFYVQKFPPMNSKR